MVIWFEFKTTNFIVYYTFNMLKLTTFNYQSVLEK